MNSEHSARSSLPPVGASFSPRKSRRRIPLIPILLTAILLAALFAAAGPSALLADGPSAAPFDLAGPGLRLKITRGGVTLPISSVASLRAGDKLWIAPDFPADQSAHYLLVVAFLQGPTNPPPDSWFTPIETWQKEPREKGTLITVPDDAQQALLFLAPETAGGFTTLRSTVRGRPGLFVRAAEDLEQASLERSRLDKFLEEIQQSSGADPVPLVDRAALLTRTLAVKADPECFTKPVDEQSSCLTQNTNSLTLQGDTSQSLVATLTSGASADLVGTLGVSPIAKDGYYSPYIGSAMDIVRLLDGLHTTLFQYLPALDSPVGDSLSLRLNSPPSFHSPRSVIVVGLPAVAPSVLPQLHALDPQQVYCLQNSALVLPVQGAPLVFSTGMAHDFVLRLENKFGQPVDLRAVADAARGGFTVDMNTLNSSQLDPEVTGTLQGSWGFEPYEGPSFHFENAHAVKWTVPPEDAKALLVGREDVLHLQAGDAACVQQVSAKIAVAQSDAASALKTSDAGSVTKTSDEGSDATKSDTKTAGAKSPTAIKPTWKAVKPDELDVQLPLEKAAAGTVTLSVQQFGVPAPDVLTLPAYGAPARLDAFAISAGDTQGVLTGAQLDEVTSFELSGVRFAVPAKTSDEGSDTTKSGEWSDIKASDAGSGIKTIRAGAEEQLALRAPSAAAIAALPVAQPLVAHVGLKDGRVLDLQTAVEPPRPKLTLLSKSVQLASQASAVHLGNQDELPQDGRLSFLLKTEVPDKFPHGEQIEVATTDGSADWFLSAANGGLVLQDSQDVLAILDPLKNLGPSAFGPLQFRGVGDNGEKGDWQPLARLVRIPTLTDVHCPEAADKPCTLSGSNLFLLDSVSADAAFTAPVAVPPGYADGMLSVPRPSGTLLYLKLRDDPSVVSSVSLPVFPDTY